ncbi:hypothetical protein ANCCAN_10669 [Ancylostoma caninum]|uniref:UBL3-like ubiquitin domain-containing protein n=1 Tax=Ancylostoma caninum TaxID=29170 RepID=A0A368GG23_ANCCA|nr:hypothetical protein ANCCAN_10669 [Ancylostoma caninum]
MMLAINLRISLRTFFSLQKLLFPSSLKCVCSEWADEKVESASMLKLIYHGRFLHGSVTLNALNLPQGKTTVMHLVTRENLPEPNSNGYYMQDVSGMKLELFHLSIVTRYQNESVVAVVDVCCRSGKFVVPYGFHISTNLTQSHMCMGHFD